MPRWPAALVALAIVLIVLPATAGDRLDRFRELGHRYADSSDPETADEILSELFTVVDDEVIDNLRSGIPFASVAFIEERVEAFSSEWGGLTVGIARPGGRAPGALTLGLFALARGEPRASLRIYGRSNAGPVALLGKSTHDGALDVSAWPDDRGGRDQFLATWLGAAPGRSSRPLYVELWRRGGPDGVARLWTTAGLVPGTLRATGYSRKGAEIVIRYEIQYPGWKAGCDAETEQEDVYRQDPRGGGLGLAARRIVNGWHRELQSKAMALFKALAAGDRRRLAELVPDAALRARLPARLEPDAVCDERDAAGAAARVLVAATETRGRERVPWSLWWRAVPGGWRLAAAAPVLQ